METRKEQFIRGLYEIGAVRFGKIILKSGLISPFYLDLRKVISHPELHNIMCELLSDRAATLDFDCVLGIPYTALPSAVSISERLKKPLFMLRKEEKNYGVGGTLVGDPDLKGRCLVVDDLITTGGSKFETTESLEKEGFTVKDILVVVDRSARGTEELAERGLKLHSIVSLDDIVRILLKDGSLDEEKAQEIRDFTSGLVTKPEANSTLGQCDEDSCPNPFTEKLLSVMKRKKTNLILSLDTEDKDEFFDILEKTADQIAMVKTHVDIIENFSPDFTRRLRELAATKDFLIFEDRKFADIGNTVKHQFYSGIYKIADWADCVTTHLIAGEGTLLGLFSHDGIPANPSRPEHQSAFLLARMSSKGNLITPDYSKQVIKAGRKNRLVVSGYIGHGVDMDDIKKFKDLIPADQLLLMPGVKLERGTDNLGQQYVTIEEAVTGGADCIIVGRGIIKSDNPAKTAEIYRVKAWSAYSDRKQSV